MSCLTEYLAQVKERAEAATEGPWKVDGNTEWMSTVRFQEDNKALFEIDPTDFNFISHARTDVPVLLEMVENLLKVVNCEINQDQLNKLESLVPGNKKEKIHQAIKDMDGKKTRNTEKI